MHACVRACARVCVLRRYRYSSFRRDFILERLWLDLELPIIDLQEVSDFIVIRVTLNNS